MQDQCSEHEHHSEKMKTSRIAAVAIMALYLILLPPRRAPDSAEQMRLENGLSLDTGILFKSKGAGVREVGFDIMADIKRGQEFLKDKTAGSAIAREEKRVVFHDRKGRKRERLVVEKVVKPNFLLAVEDLKERRIRSVHITDKGCVTDGFEVRKIKENGVGSRFEVKYPDNMAILALRTTVRSGINSFKEVVYTPYSSEIDTSSVRKAGFDYLLRQIELARGDLKARKVRLAGFEGLAADVMPTHVALVLSVIEHIDPTRFKNCQRGKELTLIREVLTIIGANTSNAYAYSKSPAGARGLFQLIPETYRSLQKKYPRSGLKENFVSGCADHINAAKASLLLFDSDLADLPRARLLALGKNPRAVGRYLAAAYNCGSRRVDRSTRECRDEWTCRLPEETKTYLRKFDVVWALRKTLDM